MNLDTIIAVRPTKTVYQDGDKVIKLFSEDYDKADILNEALNQSRVEATDLNIPKILEVTKVDDKWAIVMENAPGSTLSDLMDNNPDKIDEYLELFVNLQIEVQSKTVPLLTKLKDKMARKIEEADIGANIRYELESKLSGMPKHTKLCHGDFNPKNIIIDGDKASIIDWSHATQGNASADVARTYLLFKLEGKDELAEKYMALYCKKTSTDMKYVKTWLPIVAASQSVKGNADERAFLLSWCNIVEFE